jgi:tRNA threonylcarbamoyladenosine biosynthesis protein TsaB
MNVCAIDTATEILGICLKTDSNIIISLSLRMGFQHSTLLMPWIEHVLKQADMKAGDLDLLVCSTGPGSFTGLRIGLATIKGLAGGIGCPVIGVPTLDFLAYGLLMCDGIIVPVIDAKKKHFYVALYKDGNRISDYLDTGIDELLQKLFSYRKVILTGPAADTIWQTGNSRKQKLLLDPGFAISNPYLLLELGVRKYEKEKKGNPPTMGPLYLRKSEAELKKEESV